MFQGSLATNLFNLAELVPLWEWVKGTLQTMSFLDASTSLESSQVRSMH